MDTHAGRGLKQGLFSFLLFAVVALSGCTKVDPSVGVFLSSVGINFSGPPPVLPTLAYYFVNSGGTLNTIMPLTDGAPLAACGTPGCTLSIGTVQTSTPSGGVASLSGNTITYTAAAGFTGLETLSYTLQDNFGGSISGTVKIKVMTAYTWTGAVSGAWATAGNWYGGTAPNASSVAVFDDTCTSANCNPTLPASSVTLNGLAMKASYTGTIFQTSGPFTVGSGGFKIAAGTFSQGTTSVTVGSGGFTQTGGIFSGSASTNLTFNSGSFFNQSGGTFMAPGGTILFSGGTSFISTGGSFIAGTGTVSFGSTSSFTIDPGNIQFNNVSFSGTSGVSLSSKTMVVTGSLFQACSCQLNNGTIKFTGGTVSISSSSSSSGSAVLEMAGNAGGQVINGSSSSSVPNLKINTGTGSLTLTNTVGVSGDYTVTSVGTFITSGSTLLLGTPWASNLSPTIAAGSSTYDNVTFGGVQNYNITDVLNVNGTLTLNSGGGAAQMWGSNIYANGDVTVTANSTYVGSCSVRISGSTNQTISTATGGMLANLEIASSGGTVTFGSKVRVAADYYYTFGTVDTTTLASTLILGSVSIANPAWGPNIFPGSIAYNNITFQSDSQTFNLNNSTVSVLGNLTASFSSFGQVNSGTFNVAGDVNLGLNIPSSSTLNFVGTNNSQWSQNSGNSFTGGITVNKSAGNITLTSDVLSASSQLSIINGSITIPASWVTLSLQTLSLATGTHIHTNGGTLLVGGTSVSPGPYGAGTVD